jgi:hypothetical protein
MDSIYERIVPDYSEYRNRAVPSEPVPPTPVAAPAALAAATKK